MILVVASVLAYFTAQRSSAFERLESFPVGWLNIDPAHVIVGGHSNAADFAHQIHIAFSKTVSGVCMFAGAPYHCAVTRFAGDSLIDADGGGARGSVPTCSNCPKGKTLIYDKCKSKPWLVDVGMLPDYPRRVCRNNKMPEHDCLDSVDNLRQKRHRVYLQRGLRDKCYLKGSVANVEALYAQLLDDPGTQIHFNNTLNLPHAIPKPGKYAEAPDYDGPGECIRHTILGGKEVRSREPFEQSNIYQFDQTKFKGYDPWVGWNEFGWLYVPKACQRVPLPVAKDPKVSKKEICDVERDGFASLGPHHTMTTSATSPATSSCSLMVWLQPCGGGHNPRSISFEGFEDLAEKNKFVILTPTLRPNHKCYVKLWHGCHEVARGCWDSYGQTGEDYALKSGAHMRGVGEILHGFLRAADPKYCDS